MGFLVVIVLVFVGILVWQFIETRNALATTSVESRYTPEQCMQLINGTFGGARSVLWTDTRGPGTLNKRRRGYRGGITMSITIEPAPDGGAHVHMWASEHMQYFGVLANFAGVVSRRKRAIGRLLTQPDSQPLQAAE